MPKKKSSSPEENREAMLAMQLRMRNAALRHLKSIDARTLRVLEKLDLFDSDDASVGDDVDVGVLLDPKHERREELPVGPLVLYVTEGDDPGRTVDDLPRLLLSERVEVREAALSCIQGQAKNQPLPLTPKSVAILEKNREAIVSETPDTWRGAAVAVYDALHDDLLVALNGTRQSLECVPVIQSTLNDYAPKALRPTISSLDTIALDISKPETDHETLTQLLNKVVAEANSMRDLCSGYFDMLGFLPLAPDYSLATAVARWLVSNEEANLWDEIWGWASQARGPLPKYHACVVFILHPRLLPDGRIEELWRRVLDILGAQYPRETTDRIDARWTIRRDIARHITYHMEASIPECDSETIGCFAWWFAEQLAAVFPDNSDSARFYLEEWVKPQLDVTTEVWFAAASPVDGSLLRDMTLGTVQPWATALLALMGEQFEELSPHDQLAELQSRFHDALVANGLLSLPFATEPTPDPTFANECTLGTTILAWSKSQSGDQRQALEQIVESSKHLATAEGLCARLIEITKSKYEDRIVIASALRRRAYTGHLAADCIWETLTDADWRKTSLGVLETDVLSLLFESFRLLQIGNVQRWAGQLPHYFAELCERTEDDEQRHALFACVLYGSLAADSVSAIRRLLSGKRRADYQEIVQEYRDRFRAIRGSSPSWVNGKLRGLLAALHLTLSAR